MRYYFHFLTLFLIICTSVQCQNGPINIWADSSHGPKVYVTPYIVEGEDNMAVVVCPGGSYFWHDIEIEGHAVARWLNQHNISAFVLNYRAGTTLSFIFHSRLLFRGNRYPDAQNDLLQTLRYVRANAKRYGVDSQCVGAMGFSAGGHLVMSGAELFAPVERPAFVVPVYPVVTMTEMCVHERSRRGLLGDRLQHDSALCDILSLERHVPQDCPPVFVVNCADDPVVHPHNSDLLDSALTALRIPHYYKQYATGGHGFGVSDEKGTAECHQWRDELLRWLNTNYPNKKKILP